MSNDNSMLLQRQWLKRGPDECHKTLEDLHNKNLEKQSITRQQTVNLAEVKMEVSEGDLIMLASGKELSLSNYAFTRLAQQMGASDRYLRSLSPELVRDNMNYGFAKLAAGSKPIDDLKPWEIDESGRAIDTNAKLIYHNNQLNQLVNVVGDKYSILFDAELSKFALQLQERFGLHPAPVTTGKEGSEHHGLYASDRDCFIFLSTSDRPVLEFANNPIYKGCMLWNGFEETFGFSLFLFSGICCNYSIHQFTEKYSVSMKHTSKFFDRYKPLEMLENLSKAFDGSNHEEQEWLNKATQLRLGKEEKEVTEELLKLRIPLIGKRTAQKVYEMSHEREDMYGEPCSVYSLGNCITEIARDVPIASVKRDYMQAARKVFDLAA